MSERPPNNERGPERHPSEREIAELFSMLTEHAAYDEAQKREDEYGVYLWDIKVLDEQGDVVEYSYMRKGRYPEGEAAQTAVHVTFFDSADEPVGGHSVAKFIDGEWVVTK